MKSFFITFRSITYAQRAERALIQDGFSCHMRRTPRWMEERGCGYGVEVKTAELREPLRILKREGIPFRKTYRLRPDGAVEEPGNDLS